MFSLLQQLKNRRKDLNLKQNDMLLRIGVSRQQYQKLESKGNPRLDTLGLIAKGLNSELMLIPNEKLSAVQALLEDTVETGVGTTALLDESSKHKPLSDDPWQGMLDGDDQ
jgi:transcriptional regulator with XRE-family HTH domain